MKTSDIINQVKQLPCFSREDLRVFGLPEKTIETYLSRAAKRGSIYRLKRGLYTTKEYVLQVKSSSLLDAYKEFLANVMVVPSYISTEYILSKHELISETVHSISSITIQRPSLISNHFGNFRYRNTSNDTLSKFETIMAGPFQIKRANKLQALFDYLYLKKKELKTISLRTVEELRLNIHLLSTKELQNLGKRAKDSKSPKLEKIIFYLKELHAHQ